MCLSEGGACMRFRRARSAAVIHFAALPYRFTTFHSASPRGECRTSKRPAAKGCRPVRPLHRTAADGLSSVLLSWSWLVLRVNNSGSGRRGSRCAPRDLP